MGQGWRFSLRTIFLITLFAAMALATLRYAGIWDSVMLTVEGTMLTYALIGAICHQRAARFFWISYAICGVIQAYSAAMGEATLPGQLITLAYPLVAVQLPDPVNTGSTIMVPNQTEFLIVGQAWLFLLAGYIGGCVGRKIYLARGRAAGSVSEES